MASTHSSELKRAEIGARISGQELWLKHYVAGRLLGLDSTRHSFQQPCDGYTGDFLNRLR